MKSTRRVGTLPHFPRTQPCPCLLSELVTMTLHLGLTTQHLFLSCSCFQALELGLSRLQPWPPGLLPPPWLASLTFAYKPSIRAWVDLPGFLPNLHSGPYTFCLVPTDLLAINLFWTDDASHLQIISSGLICPAQACLVPEKLHSLNLLQSYTFANWAQ